MRVLALPRNHSHDAAFCHQTHARHDRCRAVPSFSWAKSCHFATPSTEKELLDVQNELMEQGADEDEDDKTHDVVEAEALDILADLIHLTKVQEKVLANTGEIPRPANVSAIRN